VNLVDGCASAGQEHGPPAHGDAPHGICHDTEPGIADGLHVDQVREVFQVRLACVKQLDHARLDGPVIVRTGDSPRRLGGSNALLHFCQRLWRCCPTVRGAQFEAVVGCRVVAGCDPDAPRRLERQYGVRVHRRGLSAVGQIGSDAIAGQHLGHRPGKVLRAVPRVVPHNHAAVRVARTDDILGGALRAVADVREGIVLGDRRPPPVSTEHDPIHLDLRLP